MTQDPLPLRRSRGMHDLLPPDMRNFRRIEDAFRGAAERWGYEEVRTPTLETYSLFTVAGGLTPDALSRVYTFLDWDGWSGERLVVRPDSTIPVARAAAEAGIPLPARLFYVQSRFLFSGAEEAEQWQCGLEFLDAPETAGDLEIAAAACEVLENLGLDPVVRLSHVGVAALIDGRDGNANESTLESLRQSVARPAQGASLPKNLMALAKASSPESVPALEELSVVAEALADSGRKVIIDLSMPLDFQYYTGVVMEFEQGEERVGSGGRYAPSWSGLTHTACGIALSVSPVSGLLGETERTRPLVAVQPKTPADLTRAVQVARELHALGLSASLGDVSSEGYAVEVSESGLVALTPTGRETLSDLASLAEMLSETR